MIIIIMTAMTTNNKIVPVETEEAGEVVVVELVEVVHDTTSGTPSALFWKQLMLFPQAWENETFLILDCTRVKDTLLISQVQPPDEVLQLLHA